jgi:UDP-galactopyranose mutase
MALDTLPFDLSCYHIDDEYSFSEIEQPLSEAESRILHRASQVFVHSPALLEKKGLINPHTTFVPNGVDYAAHAMKVDEPADLAAIPHPRIGYSGWLKSQLDWQLVHDLVEQHSKWSFVFVGAQHATHTDIIVPVRELAKRTNVYFLGPKSTKELAAYPQHFDVGIMPYRSTAYTKYIYPMKLHEYLASGIPIVGTRLRSLEAFEDVVALPTCREEWSTALGEALGPGAGRAATRTARQSVARRHDWDVLVRRIADIFAARLGHDLSTALPAAPGPVIDCRFVGESRTSA